jgi:tetratricopeptide (TPR) repeat protein
LRLYNERQRLAIILGDFHYATQDFQRAVAIYTDLLKGKYGFLRSEQRDYPLYALGLATYRGNWKPGGNALQEAVGIWEKVLERSDGTWTEYRAAYTIANVSRQSADESLRARGRKLLMGLARTQATNEFTQKARLALAMDLAKEGQQEAALTLLSGFKEGDGKYFALAQHLIKNAGAWAPGANKEP